MQTEYPQYFIRIYEKKVLDHKIQPTNVYIHVHGQYGNALGQKIDPQSSSREEVYEQVFKLDVLIGSRVNDVLTQFAKRVVENYKANNIGVLVDEVKQKGETLPQVWSEIQDKRTNSEGDNLWPCDVGQDAQSSEAESYPYPYMIDNTWEWTNKD